MYRKILLTHDGSEIAELAVPHAVTISKATGAAVVLLQVIDSVAGLVSRLTPMIEPVPSGEMTVDLAEQIEETQQQSAQENLDRVKAELQAQGVGEVTTKVLEGPAGDAVIDAANELGCDLIVVATHGRSGFGRALLGSVADHVVRHSKNQAVLLVRPPGG